MSFTFVPAANKAIGGAVDGMMAQMGAAAVAEARRLVHVDTGQTQRSIGFTYEQSTKTLTLHADTRWALFLELKYPFLRPALLSLRGFKLGAANFAIAFQTESGQAPSQGHLARAGRRVNRGVVKRTAIRVRKYSPHRPLS
jgi:hypothetical protein